MTVAEAKIIHISIDVPWRTVYDFAHRPENMPLWAAGLASGLTKDGDTWLADGGPLGTVRVKFSPPNESGVIDHEVTMPDGMIVYNCLRVAPNGNGAEVLFILLRQPGMDDTAFEADARHVQSDLETLRALMESGERQRAQ